MRNEYLLPGAALVGGCAGFALRRWELSTAFEGALPISGAPATLALAGLSIVMAALAIFAALRQPRGWKAGYDQAFAAQGDTLYAAGGVLSALLLALSSVLSVLDWAGLGGSRLESQTGPMWMLLSAVSLAAAVCVFLTVKNNYRAEGKGEFRFAALMPGFAGCVWLVCVYQSQAAVDPILLNFVYRLSAVVLTLLALYYYAAFAYQRGRLPRAVVCSLLGCYFSVVALADSPSPADLARFGFAAVYLAVQAYALLRSAARPLGPRMPEKETGKEDLNTEGSSDE